MSLRLEIVSRHRQQLGERGVKVFGQDGGTIGRSLETDWALPDKHRFLSSRHASIDYRSGAYYIVDTSKNGVYINGSEEPVGRGKPQRLFSGDRISIGEYEMTVAIENVDDTCEALASTSHVDPVDLKQRVEAPDPASCDLVEEHVITGVGIEMFLEDDEPKTANGNASSPLELELEATGKPSSARTAEAARPASTATPRAEPKAPPKRKPAANAAPTVAATRNAAGNALAAFYRGAGLTPPSLSPEQSEALMTRLGQVTRELVAGLIDSLHLRSLQKAQLKQASTTNEPRSNNGLELSDNVGEAFEQLLLGSSEQYLPPVESVRSAFADITQHQRALLKAVRRALDEYLERLEPEQLEQKFSKGKAGSIMGAASKLKYWDLYKDLYLMLSQHQPDELPQAFLDALGRAYQEETTVPSPTPQRQAG